MHHTSEAARKGGEAFQRRHGGPSRPLPGWYDGYGARHARRPDVRFDKGTNGEGACARGHNLHEWDGLGGRRLKDVCFFYVLKLTVRFFTDSWDKRIDIFDYDVVSRYLVGAQSRTLAQCLIVACSLSWTRASTAGRTDCASTRKVAFGQHDGAAARSYG
jgi:hypothetical protein